MPIRTIGLPIQGLDDHDSVTIDDLHCANLRNVRSTRDRIELAPGGTLLAPAPTPSVNPGYGMRTGTFVMRTTAGAQVITHNLGFTPVAAILFTAGPTTLARVEDDWRYAVGMTDGTASRSAAIATASGNPSHTAKRYAAAILTLVDDRANTLSEAQWTAWTSSTMTITWSVVDGQPRQIGFIVLGNASLTAKLIPWTTNTSTGNQAVTGAGFTPDVVIHLHSGVVAGGNSTGATFGMGAMAPSGLSATSVALANNASPHTTYAVSTSQRALTMLNTGGTVAYAATATSFDVDGFTVNFLTAPAAGQIMASLCLDGFSNVSVGQFSGASVTPPGQSAFTSFGYQPTGIIHFGGGNSTIAPGMDAFIGCADGTSQASAGVTDGPTGANGGQTRSDAFYTDTDAPGQGVNGSGIDFLYSLKSYDPNGFTIQATYSATSPLVPVIRGIVFQLPSTLGSLGVIRNYGDLIVGGVVPTEKIVMLTSKSAFVYSPVTSKSGIFGATAEVYTGTDIQRFSIANGTDSSGALAAWSQGKDNIRKYNGAFSALITSGTNHAARTLLPFNNRLVSVRPFFGGVDYKTQIRFSVNGDYSDFSGIGSGVLEVVETSNQPLTGGIVLGNRCYLTRGREVIELIATGSLSPVFIPEVKVSGIGCIATHSMAAGDIYAFWLGPDEIYQWDGAQLKAVGGRTYNTITALVDYENLDQIQATVYEPDSQYHIVVPPYRFVYDYRRDIWDWDDTRSFQAIGRLTVADQFTGDIDHSEFTVLGDSSVQTIRDDPSVTTYLGTPIDAYFETGDKLPLGTHSLATGQQGRAFEVEYDRLNSVYRVWFRGTPGEVVEVGVSVDKGVTYTYAAQPTTQIVTVNATGVGVGFFLLPFGSIRLRFRSQAGSVYSIQGNLQFEFQESGMNLPG